VSAENLGFLRDTTRLWTPGYA